MKKTFAALCMALAPLYGEINTEENDLSATATCCEPTCCSTLPISFRAEALYWKAQACGLESAFGKTRIHTHVKHDIVTTTVREKDREPHSKWNGGFRLGASAVYECLDFAIDWTHYNGRAHDHGKTDRHFLDRAQAQDEPNESNREFRKHKLNPTVKEDGGHWDLKYDTIDFTVAAPFYNCNCFSIKPFAGVRVAKIYQKLDSHLETFYKAENGEGFIFSDLENKGNFWGVGPIVGLEANWVLFCNLSLYGSIDVVTYSGHAKSRNHNTDTFTKTISESHVKKHHCFDNLATDGAIGIRWDKSWCFSSCQGDFSLKLGWEQHRIYNFTDIGCHSGPLTLDGAVLAAILNFNY